MKPRTTCYDPCTQRYPCSYRYDNRGGGGDRRGISGGGDGGRTQDWLTPLNRNERLESELFGGGHGPSGINFDRYEDIPVEATGNDVPSGIDDVIYFCFLLIDQI